MRTSPTTALMPEAAPWCLYLLECRHGAYYAGIPNRPEARDPRHSAGPAPDSPALGPVSPAAPFTGQLGRQKSGF